MSLIGLPLLLLSTSVLAVWVAALVIWWPRLRRWWRLARIGGLVICQILLVFVVGLVVNRTEDFYPSWAALLGSDPPKVVTAPAPVIPLASWLQQQAARGARSGLSFPWQASQDKHWYLRAPTTVLLPEAYFRPTAPILPVVVVVVGPEHTATALSWGLTKLAPLSTVAPAVIILVQPGAKGPSPDFGAQLVTQLGADLHVSAGDWGLVGVGSGATASVDLFRSDADRFGCLVLPIGDPVSGAQAHRFAEGRPVLIGAKGGVSAALRWVYENLPPTLEPPLVVAASSPAPRL